MRTLDAVFTGLGDAHATATDEHLYTALAPLYGVMYVARNRIQGQLAAVQRVAPPDATTVLEFGCGTGHLLAELESSFGTAVGADPSREMAHLARERAGCVCQADAHAFATDSADVAVLLGTVLGHIRPDSAAREAVSEVQRALRPGGHVVCSAHRVVAEPRSRELTRRVDGYEITQHGVQRPADEGTFEWEVTFGMTDEATGETRHVSTATTLRAFTPSELTAWFERAGFESVETRPREYVDGPGETDRAFLLTARCPG